MVKNPTIFRTKIIYRLTLPSLARARAGKESAVLEERLIDVQEKKKVNTNVNESKQRDCVGDKTN